jgi:hypothetical protein
VVLDEMVGGVMGSRIGGFLLLGLGIGLSLGLLKSCSLPIVLGGSGEWAKGGVVAIGFLLSRSSNFFTNV